MTVTGGLDVPAQEHRQGFAASIVVGLGAGVLLAAAAGAATFGGVDAIGVLALAPWLPSLLAQDYCRGAAFRARRPHVALISDVAFAVVQAGATIVLALSGGTDVSAFVAAWGIGATAGALVGAALLHVRPGLRGGVAKLRLLWPRSRWFLAEFGTSFPSDQGYLFLLPALLGTAQFGLYRAASGLIGPVVVLFLAAGNVGLPDAVRSLRNGGGKGLNRFVVRLTAVVAVGTALYCATIAVLAEPLLRLVFGAPFEAAATVTVLVAIQYVLYALAFGAGVGMKAAGRMKELWVVRAVTAAITIAAVAVLASRAGLLGAGIAAVIAGAGYAAGVLVAYRVVLARGSSHSSRNVAC
jgi:O-antigen/teichoic acid export membrane protein